MSDKPIHQGTITVSQVDLSFLLDAKINPVLLSLLNHMDFLCGLTSWGEDCWTKTWRQTNLKSIAIPFSKQQPNHLLRTSLDFDLRGIIVKRYPIGQRIQKWHRLHCWKPCSSESYRHSYVFLNPESLGLKIETKRLLLGNLGRE